MAGAQASWPEGFVARPLSTADVDAWVALLTAVEAVEHAGEHFDADHLAEELDNPKLNPAADTIGLWQDDQLVAFALVNTPPSVIDLVRLRAEGAVHPAWRRRGLGSALVRWMQARATAIREERFPGQQARLGTGGLSDNDGLRAILERAGFEPVRWFLAMERELAGDQIQTQIPSATAPEGGRISLFEPVHDEPTLEAHNEAFLDHWGFTPRDREFWQTHVTKSRAFRPGLSSLLLDADDRVVAYALAYEFVAESQATGRRNCYLGQIGTRREWRGRGAARALVANTLAGAQAAGYDCASLAVDADNPTGALGLYERLGFQVRHRRTAYGYPF